MCLVDFDVSELILSMIGFVKLRWNLHMLIRAFVVLNHCITFAYGGTLSEFANGNPNFRILLLVSNWYRNCQVLYLYLKRLGRADTRNSGFRYEKRTQLVVIFIVIVNIAADFVNPNHHFPPGTAKEFQKNGRVLRTLCLLSYTFVRLETVILCADLSDEIRKGGRENRNILRGLNSNNAAEKCRKSSKLCNELSESLNGPLTSIFVEFFLRFVTRVPFSVHSLRCASQAPAWLGKLVVHLSVLLFIVYEGDRISMTNRRARREVQLTKSFFERNSEETRLFTGKEHGVQLTFGAVLSWRSFSSLVGLTWQFAFTVLQIVISAPSSMRQVC